MNNAAENKLYSYSDYKSYGMNERIEIIDGHIHDMAPTPARIHQKLIVELSTLINNHLKANNSECELYVAPFDVLFTNDNTDSENCINIVQPDISIICDKNKLNDKGCIGAPDLIIEIVSPFNPSNDYIRKLNLYSHYKVREYFIINPANRTILEYRLDENMQYTAPESYTFDNTIKVGIFNNLAIDFPSLGL